MPVYVRQEALEVPTPTLSECSEEGIQDPEEIFPERTGTAGYVREVLSDVFNTCWMSVEKKQNEKETRARLKVDVTADLPFAEQVDADKFTCVTTARDFVFGGTEAGFVHCYDGDGNLLDSWQSPEEHRITDVWGSALEPIESVSHCVVADEMGNAWWLVITEHGLVLVKEVTEDKVKVRCDDCKYSKGGYIIAVGVSTATDSWVVSWKMTPSIINSWTKALRAPTPPPPVENPENPDEEPLPVEKYVPQLTMTPAIKILRPKAELKPKKNSFITMRTQIARDGLVADITADEHPYLFTDRMKKYRIEEEEQSFENDFPTDRPMDEEEISILMNGPAMFVILEPLDEPPATASSQTNVKNPDANARIHQFGIATTQQNTAKAYVYRYEDVKGRVLPYQGLPHTERIDAFATDCQRTLFIATCCANGTISLWKRVSAKQLVPVFVCPSLKNISVISMAVQPKLGTQTADILCHDVTKALVIVEDDETKYMSLLNDRRVIYDHVEEFHQTADGYVARLNEISIHWQINQTQVVRKWMLPETCEDLNRQSYSRFSDCIYYVHGHHLKVARFV